MKRNFKEWFSTFTDCIAPYDYYTDFNTVYKNIDKIKVGRFQIVENGQRTMPNIVATFRHMLPRISF